jgi:hypothetical protein
MTIRNSTQTCASVPKHRQQPNCIATDYTLTISNTHHNRLVGQFCEAEGGGEITPGIFLRRGVQQIQLRTEGRENRELEAVAPQSGVPLNLQMSETRILIRLLWMCFPRSWEFGSALLTLRNFVGGEV